MRAMHTTETRTIDGVEQMITSIVAHWNADLLIEWASPRLLRWSGAVHDVPLQWPALVSGLVRAAAEEVATAAAGAGTAP